MTYKPMKAKEASKAFVDSNWLHEIKIDGGRCLASVSSLDVLLESSSGRDITRAFPEIRIEAKVSCIVDGELASPDLKIKGFATRVHRQNEREIADMAKANPIVYYAFDILEVDGKPSTGLGLVDRKSLLNEVIIPNESVRLLPFSDNGIALSEATKKEGLEGIMSKRKSSTYQAGKRSNDWLKIKNFIEETFTIYGVMKGENRRDNTFGSLILGKFNVYVGCCGTGFDDKTLASLTALLKGWQ